MRQREKRLRVYVDLVIRNLYQSQVGVCMGQFSNAFDIIFLKEIKSTAFPNLLDKGNLLYFEYTFVFCRAMMIISWGRLWKLNYT